MDRLGPPLPDPDAFVDLQRRIVKHKASILAAIEHGLSNGRIESVNTKIRLITRIAFGFRSPRALIALAMLNLGGHPPALPGRTCGVAQFLPSGRLIGCSGVRRRGRRGALARATRTQGPMVPE